MQFAPLILTVLVVAACGTPAQTDKPMAPLSDTPTGMILDEIPDTVDPGRRYLLYLHNRFAEHAQPSDRHPTFGVYDLRGILEAFAERRFIVIAAQREPGADPARWATRVAGQVKRLMAAGVSPENIAVVGFSKGGAIAILTSSKLADDRVNFVFLAACGEWTDRVPDLQPRGRLLSITEASDDMAGTCGRLFSMAIDGTIHEEIEVRLGGGHGAFFTPQPEWIEPAAAWASGKFHRHPKTGP